MPSKETESIQLLQGTLDLIVLRTLTSMGPQHAYQIANRLEQVSGKLLNLNHCSLELTEQELVALAQQFNALRLSARLGPSAVVVASEAMYRQVSHFKAMTALARPLQIFDEHDAAYAWLMANPSEPSSPFGEVPKARTEQGQPEDTRY